MSAWMIARTLRGNGLLAYEVRKMKANGRIFSVGLRGPSIFLLQLVTYNQDL